MYQFLKPFLFRLAPETAHDITLGGLSLCAKSTILTKVLYKIYGQKISSLPVSIMGLNFEHPIGLAAGLDKDARAFNAFSALGFSAVEMGTVTPLPQPGNPKPRMFRLTEDRAIINRMGFNSGGLTSFLNNIKAVPRRSNTIAGINIGKNKLTSNEHANSDYINALNAVYMQADYITVNISSPNTESLRELQGQEPLNKLLTEIGEARQELIEKHKLRKPIALKIAPDLTSSEIKIIAELLIDKQFDALIATNTTVTRMSSLRSGHQNEQGGLSGAVLKKMSNEVIAEFYSHLKGQVPIIGVGGIETAEDAWEKLLAGADFLQIYSGLIYHGPEMIQQIVTGLQDKTQHYSSLAEALSAERM